MADCFILFHHKKRNSAVRLMSVFLETVNIQPISTAIVNYVEHATLEAQLLEIRRSINVTILR